MTRLFYHVCTINHWRDVVLEQLAAVKAGGYPGPVFYRFTGTADERHFMWHAQEATGVKLVHLGDCHVNQYEFPTLGHMDRWARENDGVVGYFHTKAVSHPNSWHSMLWRKAMNRACLRDWEARVNEISGGADVAGLAHVNWNGAHMMAGNCYWQSCASIRQLPTMRDYRAAWNPERVPWDKSGRHAAEFWHGSRPGTVFAEARQGWNPGDSNWWAQHPEAQQWAMT